MTPNPASVGAEEKPKPGREGATTWKEGLLPSPGNVQHLFTFCQRILPAEAWTAKWCSSKGFGGHKLDSKASSAEACQEACWCIGGYSCVGWNKKLEIVELQEVRKTDHKVRWTIFRLRAGQGWSLNLSNRSAMANSKALMATPWSEMAWVCKARFRKAQDLSTILQGQDHLKPQEQGILSFEGRLCMSKKHTRLCEQFD